MEEQKDYKLQGELIWRTFAVWAILSFLGNDFTGSFWFWNWPWYGIALFFMALFVTVGITLGAFTEQQSKK